MTEERDAKGRFVKGHSGGWKKGCPSPNPQGAGHPTATLRRELRKELAKRAEDLVGLTIPAIEELFETDPAAAIAALIRVGEFAEGKAPPEVSEGAGVQAVITFHRPEQLEPGAPMPSPGSEQPGDGDQ